jgi:hypothetical protein
MSLIAPKRFKKQKELRENSSKPLEIWSHQQESNLRPAHYELMEEWFWFFWVI